jgi:hypothetical protein
MAQHRNVACDCIADQRKNRRYPRQIVIHAHRSAHEYQAGKLAGIYGYGITGIDAD